jgi:hypothetical protein
MSVMDSKPRAAAVTAIPSVSKAPEMAGRPQRRERPQSMMRVKPVGDNIVIKPELPTEAPVHPTPQPEGPSSARPPRTRQRPMSVLRVKPVADDPFAPQFRTTQTETMSERGPIAPSVTKTNSNELSLGDSEPRVEFKAEQSTESSRPPNVAKGDSTELNLDENLIRPELRDAFQNVTAQSGRDGRRSFMRIRTTNPGLV